MARSCVAAIRERGCIRQGEGEATRGTQATEGQPQKEPAINRRGESVRRWQWIVPAAYRSGSESQEEAAEAAPREPDSVATRVRLAQRRLSLRFLDGLDDLPDAMTERRRTPLAAPRNFRSPARIADVHSDA